MTVETPDRTPKFAVLERHRADDLFAAPGATRKWSPLVAELMGGNAVFVPGMTRTELESLRTVVRYRAPAVMLLSRRTDHDGVLGRLLRITQKGR